MIHQDKNGKTYKLVDSDNGCTGCAFNKLSGGAAMGDCPLDDREYLLCDMESMKHFVPIEVIKTQEIIDSMATCTKGAKYDKDKPMYDLIPPSALEEFVNVLTFGAKKYAPDNWRLVPEGRRRYFAAAQRHLWQFKRGETIDKESNLHHLAHAITCLMFILEKEMLNEEDLKEQPKG